MGGACSTYGEEKRCIQILVGNPEERRTFGRPRRRWEDSIKKNIQEVRWAEWNGLIWLWKRTGGGLLLMR